ncbi:MAG TPA: type II secretion system protein [Clostridia bacterium]|nr:type II secretion system protein [Clostridia bacterium]
MDPRTAGYRVESRAGLHRGFTLLEIMIVVGIMGIVLTMGVPLVYKVLHRAPMNQAVKDIVEVSSHARARAILQGKMTYLVIRPRDGRLGIEGAPAAAERRTEAGDPISGPAAVSAPSGSGESATLSDRVLIQMLDINKLPHDFRDDDVAKVRFFPNGTCDELTIILVDDKGEQRAIMLEVTTGLATVLTGAELQKFRNGLL